MIRYLYHKRLFLIDQAFVSLNSFITVWILGVKFGMSFLGEYSLYFSYYLLGIACLQALVYNSWQVDQEFIKRIPIGLLLLVLFPVVTIYIINACSINQPGHLLGFIFLLVTSLLTDIVRRILLFTNDLVSVVIFSVSAYGIQILLLLASLFYKGFNVNWFFLIAIASSFIGIGYFVVVKSFRNSVSTVKVNWKLNWILFTSVLSWFSGNVILLESFSLLGSSVTGEYRSLLNLFSVTNVIILVAENSIHTEEDNRAGFRRFLFPIRYYFVIIVMFVLCFLLFGSTIQTSFLRTQLPNYMQLIPVLGINTLLALTTIPIRFYLRKQGLTMPIFLGYCISTAFVMLLGSSVLLCFGQLGIAIGTVLAQLITIGTYLVYLIAERRQIKELKKIVVP